MKKFLFSVIAMLAIGSTAFGENSITVDPFTISNKGKTALMVNIKLDGKSTAKGMAFNISLPAGLEFVTNGGAPVYTKGSMCPGEPTLNIENGILYMSAGSKDFIKGSKGLLIAFQIQPTTSFNANENDVLVGNVSDVIISLKNGDSTSDTKCSNSTFNMTVADCDVVLDENSPFAPEKTKSSVDILVKRTLTKDKWSTFCLPFDIDWTTFKSIFGDDVKLAEFDSYSSEDNFETMSINFLSIDMTGADLENASFYGTFPYLIKTSKTIESFEINAKISSTEADEDQYKSGKTTKGRFIGTFVADTTVPKDDLFISNNTFYYSIGTTKIKGFRGYFEFNDMLNYTNTARAFFNIDGDGTTKIQNAQITKNETGKVYSISGRYMGENVNMKSLPKGVYVVDGVKVINN